MPLNSEQKFWISSWALLALFLAVLIVCMTVSDIHDANVKADLLAKNISALHIKCVMDGNLNGCQGVTQDSIQVPISVD